jgi:transmembrane sensor
MSEKPYSAEMLALAEKWIAGTITPEERTRLFEWYDRFDDTELTIQGSEAAVFSRLKQEMLQDIRKKIKPPAKLRRLARVSVAAAVLLLVATGGWLTLHNRTTTPLATANTTKNTSRTNDIAPGSNKATLTLADGSKVTLDSAHTGNLTSQGNVAVIKRGDGQLQYASTNTNGNTPAASMVYNILSTPRGGEYRLKLQDGTNVWLNASSSIRYPTTFAGKERRVEITGEAYFEVAKNADMPFRVSVAGPAIGGKNTEIEVLGTGFDVNAYQDEADQKTTLIEGAIKVTSSSDAVTLHPSEQAISSGTHLKTLQLENPEQTIAWKNGYFEFDNADIPTIMRQISRWYDVDVEYQGKASEDRFSGRFSRNVSLAVVLQILHTSGVQLLADDKKIVIRS